MLPNNNSIFVEIGDIGTSNAFWIFLKGLAKLLAIVLGTHTLHDHPAQVRVEKTLTNTVRILVGVGITMMSTVITTPPSNWTFYSTTST
jgi:hypothetical protein